MNDAKNISISILIATRNRAGSLSRTLESLFTVRNVSRSDWEVVVVDNGSTDHTSTICKTYRETHPNQFNFAYENRGGKSCALNTGILLCEGTVLALIDDDVICTDGYLDGIRSSVSENRGSVIQGRVLVDYDGKLPCWFDEYFESMMCRIDLGDGLCPLHPPRQLWGLNAVLPMRSLDIVGGFCPQLGAGAIGFAEDVEFSRRLRNAGYPFLYDPRIIVRHQISSARLKIRYVFKRSYLMGRSFAYYESVPVASLLHYTAYIAKEILLKIPELLLNLSFAKWGLAIRRACEYLTSLGFVSQHWRFRISGYKPELTTPRISTLHDRHRSQLNIPECKEVIVTNGE